MAAPRGSIIIVAFNEAEKGWLASSLESVLAAANSDEVIFVDDASTDDTPRVLARFPEVRYLRLEKRIGTAPARNRGAAIAKGQAFCFLDAHVWPRADCFDLLFGRVLETRVPIIATPAIGNSDWRNGIPNIGGRYRWNFGSCLAWSCARNWFYLGIYRNKSRGRNEAVRNAAHGCGLTLTRRTFEMIRGWVNMPGFWGGNDAAISVKAWLCDVPIVAQFYARLIHSEKPTTWHHAPLRMQGMTRIYGARALFDDDIFEGFWLPRFRQRYRWRAGWDELLERGRAEQREFAPARKRDQWEFIEKFVGDVK